jgi:hypothetical protein
MSTTTINLTSYVNGLLTDLDSAKLSDATATYGVKRTDTGATVVNDNTSFTHLAQGTYQYAFTDPAADLTYEIAFELTYGGETRRYTRISTAGTVSQNYLIPVDDHFSSEAEVIRFMGENAVILITDDWDYTDKSPIWNDILDFVDDTIWQNIEQHYDPTTHLGNSYLRRRATILAAHLLSQRRGNPALYARLADEVKEEFNDIRRGNKRVPRGTPIGNLGPVVRNYTMQPMRVLPMRVEKFKSTGDSYSNERIAYEPFLFIF